MITQYIVDIIGDIVTATATGLNRDVNYLYGHPFEVIDDLKLMTDDPTYSAKKYPLVALFTDFAEKKGQDGIESEVALNIIICTLTQNTLMAKARYTNAFKPILYPIYNEFLKQVKLSQKFTVNNEDLIPHTKTDRLYWGRVGLYGKEGNLFNDYIDAIELENFQLKLKSVIC